MYPLSPQHGFYFANELANFFDLLPLMSILFLPWNEGKCMCGVLSVSTALTSYDVVGRAVGGTFALLFVPEHYEAGMPNVT